MKLRTQVELLNQEEAGAEIAKILDKEEHALVLMAYTSAVVEFVENKGSKGGVISADLPVENFDMLFFVRIMKRNFSNKRAVLHIFEEQPKNPKD